MTDLEKNDEVVNVKQSQKRRLNKKPYRKGSFIGIGIALGVVYGVVFDNIPIGICLGVAIGVAIDATMANRNKKQ